MKLTVEQIKEIDSFHVIDRQIAVECRGAGERMRAITISYNALKYGLPARLSTIIEYLDRLIGEGKYPTGSISWVDNNPVPSGLDQRDVEIARLESMGYDQGKIADEIRLWEMDQKI